MIPFKSNQQEITPSGSGKGGEFNFYEDKDLVIKANIEWDNNDIKKIDFTPYTLSSGSKYVIHTINPCLLKEGNCILHFVIHIYLEANPPSDLTYEAHINNQLKGINLNNKRDTATFWLNPHDKKPDTSIDKCKFNESIPETKGGAIIISI